MHARSGGNLEVMGMLLGKIDGENMIVMDSFALPVEGTGAFDLWWNISIVLLHFPRLETRVNAQQEAYEYMSSYTILVKDVNRPENVIGWYHSHPGYGCWLSGIDCNTQMQNQQYQDPFVAIVVGNVRQSIDFSSFFFIIAGRSNTNDLRWQSEYRSVSNVSQRTQSGQ